MSSSSTSEFSDDGISTDSSSTSLQNGNSSDEHPFDKSTIADLIAEHGTSCATAWLEFDRYKIWRPSPANNVPAQPFLPVQGYMQRDPWIFAWGNPLVPDPSFLDSTATAFVRWAEARDLRLVWACVDADLEYVLGDTHFGWSTVNCIYEDVVDPAHVVELTNDDSRGHHGAALVKDLKKNLRRAEREHIIVQEMRTGDWTDKLRKEVEVGIDEWRKVKSGLQLASTSLQPWLDEKHRRYWLARKDNESIGIIILTPIRSKQWQIKNALSFPSAPKGTSEDLIYTALKDLHEEDEKAGDADDERVTVTFGITASEKMKPVHNLSGWKVTTLSKTYNKIAGGAGLLRRGDFRGKFDSEKDPMYVCYPKDGFGLDGINALLKTLKKN